MEPKYRTLVQAALLILVLAFVVHRHGEVQDGGKIAGTTARTHR
jgi:hypothetical protein